MAFFKSLFGICNSPKLESSLWTYDGQNIIMKKEDFDNLNLSGVNIESKELPYPVLLFKGDDSVIYAVKNRCPHMKRKIDPIPGNGTLRCCSVMHSSFSYDGKYLNGPAHKDLTTLDVSQKDGQIYIKINGEN